MRQGRRFLHKLRNLFQAGKAEADLEREVQSHLEMLSAHFRESGLTDDEARLAAKRAYGSVEFAKELQRDARSWIPIESLLQDLRFALRSLGRYPGFSAVAILTLALGIGANSAVFKVLDSILLRPLPYHRSNEIVQLNLELRSGGTNSTLNVPEFEFLRDHSKTFASVAGLRGSGTMLLKRHGAPNWIHGLRATEGVFGVLDVHPALGRGFEQDDTRPGSPQVAVLSDALWRSTFGADPGAIGQQIELNDSTYTVVGVMPRDFRFVGSPADIIIALPLSNGIVDTGLNTQVIARLKPGVTMAQAQANVDGEFAALRSEGRSPSSQRGIRLESYQTWLAGDLRTSVLVLFAAVSFLLLIACANVASLLMARATSRQREVAIRLAIGCGRAHLIQQFVMESFALALGGTIAGVIAAGMTLRVLLPSIPWNVSAIGLGGVDARMVWFTLGLTLVTTFLFGIASYWQVSKLSPSVFLKGGVQQAGQQRARRLLVMGEVAVAAMLLVNAGLLIETLYRLHQQRLGFEPEHVVTMTTVFEQKQNVLEFEKEALRRIQAIPGVSSAALTSGLPLSGPDNLPTQQEGRPEHSIGGMEYRAVSPDYFRTMKIPLLRGRAFQQGDNGSAVPVAIVSESVARAWWGSENPLGGRVVVGQYQGRAFPEVLERPRQIVGVVADVKNLAMDEADPATVYVPAEQLPRSQTSAAWVVRTEADVPLGAELRKAVLTVRPDQRILEIEPMTEIVARSIARPAFNASLMAVFGGLALLLTGIGIYGLLSFQVERRRREVAVRIALGAKRLAVISMVVKETLVLMLMGIAAGSVGAFVLGRLLASFLGELWMSEPFVYFGVAGILLFVGLIASYLPARRASGIDPVRSLRYD